ncbi:unnamed protein product, partial [Ectocarpus sp. 8 AP-2014]
RPLPKRPRRRPRRRLRRAPCPGSRAAEEEEALRLRRRRCPRPSARRALGTETVKRAAALAMLKPTRAWGAWRAALPRLCQARVTRRPGPKSTGA